MNWNCCRYRSEEELQFSSGALIFPLAFVWVSVRDDSYLLKLTAPNFQGGDSYYRKSFCVAKTLQYLSPQSCLLVVDCAASWLWDLL